MLAIQIKTTGFKEAEKALANVKNGFPKAATEAINRGLIAGRQEATKDIRARYNIKAGALKGEGFTIKKASWTAIGGTLEAKGPMLPVKLFSPTVRTKRIVRRGPRAQFVSVAIIRGSRKLVKGAFMTSSGNVMERRQPERYPIFPVSTIGVPFMVGYLGIATKVEERIAEITEKRLAHNVARLLGGGK